MTSQYYCVLVLLIPSISNIVELISHLSKFKSICVRFYHFLNVNKINYAANETITFYYGKCVDFKMKSILNINF